MEQGSGLIQPLGRLVLRADAGPRTGIGHVMRCLAIGEEWVSRGGRAVLLGEITGEGIQNKLREASIELIPWRGLAGSDADLAALLDLTADSAAVVIDGYEFAAEYFRQAGDEIPLAVVADSADVPLPASTLVVSHHVHADEPSYRASSPGAVRALGPEFALLRRALRQGRTEPQLVSARATKVLITAGGGGAGQLSQRLVRKLRSIGREDLEIRVIHGPAALPSATSGDPITSADAEIVVDPPTMGPHFSWADIAIAAAGGTALELAYFGVPSVLLAAAPNQRPVASAMEHAGVARNLGAVDGALDVLPDVFKSLADDPRARQQMRDAGRRLVDGRGPGRVADLISGMVEMRQAGLRLRPVVREDDAAVLDIANSAGTRENSLTTRKISATEHSRWFADRVDSADTRMWVLDAGESLACQVRYDRASSDEAQVAIVTAPSWRGKGLATKLLVMTAPLAFTSLRVRRITATVVSGNTASGRAFLSAAYTPAGDREAGGRKCQIFQRERVQ